MDIHAMMERETRTMGRELKLVKARSLPDVGLALIVYDAPHNVGNPGHTRRWAVYTTVGDDPQPLGSGYLPR